MSKPHPESPAPGAWYLPPSPAPALSSTHLVLPNPACCNPSVLASNQSCDPGKEETASRLFDSRRRGYVGLLAFLPKPEHFFVVVVNSFIEIILKITFRKIRISYSASIASGLFRDVYLQSRSTITIISESKTPFCCHPLILYPSQPMAATNFIFCFYRFACSNTRTFL